jgi:hypothetical protein
MLMGQKAASPIIGNWALQERWKAYKRRKTVGFYGQKRHLLKVRA